MENDIPEHTEEKKKKKKLQLEITELEKKWYQKPSFLLPIIGSLSSIILLFSTGFFETKSAELRIERARLTLENEKLIDKQLQLAKDTLKLAQDTLKLSREKQIIEYEKDQLENAKIQLELGNKILALRQDSLKLAETILLESNSLLKLKTDSLTNELDKANRPKLSFLHNDAYTSKIIDLTLKNSGLGPAYINKVNYIVDEEDTTNYVIDVLILLDINYAWIRYYHIEPRPNEKDFSNRFVLAASERIELLKLETDYYSSALRDQFNNALDRLSIEIEYCASNGDCFTVRYN